METEEYTVKMVRRYVVTRFHSGPNGAGTKVFGEFESSTQANEVAEALRKRDDLWRKMDDAKMAEAQRPE